MPRRGLGHVAVAAWAILMLGFGPSLGTARAASYSITFENHSGSTVWIAVMERGEDGCLDHGDAHGDFWSVHGWVEVQRGTATTYYTSHNGFYYYAENADGFWGGEEGDGSYWGDDFLVYVSDSEFQYCRPNDGSGGAPGPDYYPVPMRGLIPDGRDGNGNPVIELID